MVELIVVVVPETVRSPLTIKLLLKVVLPDSVAPLKSTVPVNVLLPLKVWALVRVANAPEPAIEMTEPSRSTSGISKAIT